ncbi:YncE family protein [Delftia sp. GW456-R20]|uniref:YncE family protein n=1 Tax=Delftia sp. GW456-R20 TaxID=1827145 RepID=UPI000AC59C3A|nr:hypothetical protein [Delftia sp. GW456-R20]
MPKRLLGFFNGEATPIRALKVRQGLPVTRDDSFPLALLSSASGGNGLILSPDRTYALGLSQTSSNNYWIYPDARNLASYTTSSVVFAGSISHGAVSNEFYAICGASPYLYVFNKAGTLQTVNTTGLGTAYYIDFSPDGKYMAVIHSTNPYLRIYKTSDWSYVNATTNSGSIYQGCFSHDSSKFVAFNDSTNCVSKYDPATGVRTTVSTNTAHRGGNSTYGTNRAVRYPDGKTIIYIASSSDTLISYFDSTTDTITNSGVAAAGLSPAHHIVIPPNTIDEYFYVFHGFSASLNRSLSKIKFSGKEMVTDAAENLALRNLALTTSTANSASCLFIDTTPHRIVGTVRDVANLPVKRMVRAFQRTSGELMAQTYSDASTGNYTLLLDNAGPFDVQFYTEAGELLNDLFYSKVEAEPIG